MKNLIWLFWQVHYFLVNLVEKKPTLRGKSLSFDELYNVSIEKQEILELINDLKTNSNVHILTNSRVKNVNGYVGNYDIIT